jgi:flagellar biosynthesis protein FlhG
MSAQLWVVGAGKGGVGKTFVSSSLGVTLSKLNHKVLLIDFDLSGANLHTTFGSAPSEKNIHCYFSRNAGLMELISTTEIPRVSLIQGFWDAWQPMAVTSEQTLKLIQDCKALPFDYVIFDLGAGPAISHLELFSHADEKILISNSEPTCVEKNYRLIESFICHSLRETATPESFDKLKACLREYRSTHKTGYFSFREHLKKSFEIQFDFFEQLRQDPMRLIINESRSRLDQDLGFSMKSVCHKYYDFSLDYVGAVDFDNAVWQSVKSREPVLIEKPFTPLAGQFLTICKQLTNPNFNANLYRAVV